MWQLTREYNTQMVKELKKLWKDIFSNYHPEDTYMKGDSSKKMKQNPHKRIDSDKMTDKEKMDKGFSNGTYNINGRDVDF